MIFSLLTFSVAIPSAIKVFNWLATMYKGSIHLTTPMCYALIFIFLFGLGGLTGLFLGALATDIQVHDTSFVVAHFHYQMLGGVGMAFFAGMYHWWPKMTGKMFNDKFGKINAALMFVAFNVTYFPQFIIGSRGMPRRYFDYELLLDKNPEITAYQMVSTAGGLILIATFFGVFINLVMSLFNGKPAPANPWGGATMEWQCTSPPSQHNFDKPPEANDPYDFDDIKYDAKIKGYVTVQ